MKYSLVAIILGTLLSIPGFAQLQISTLDKPRGVFSNVGYNVSQGFAFTTDAIDYSLTGVLVRLSHRGSGDESGLLLADLYLSDGLARPTGSSLVSFTTAGEIPASAVASINFTPATSYVLTSNTEYVFVLSATPDSWPGWVMEFTPVDNG